MAYKVIRTFADAEDGGRVYDKVGQKYPHKDSKVKPTKERIKKLSSSDNNAGSACIQEIKTKEEVLNEMAADSK